MVLSRLYISKKENPFFLDSTKQNNNNNKSDTGKDTLIPYVYRLRGGNRSMSRSRFSLLTTNPPRPSFPLIHPDPVVSTPLSTDPWIRYPRLFTVLHPGSLSIPRFGTTYKVTG